MNERKWLFKCDWCGDCSIKLIEIKTLPKKPCVVLCKECATSVMGDRDKEIEKCYLYS